jgi:hypothetical protein
MAGESPLQPSDNRQPFTFAAVTTKELSRGELVQFNVDANGKITSPQLEFIQPMTPRILKAPADA